MATKPEGIAEDGLNVGITCSADHVVKVAIRIRVHMIDRGVNLAVSDRKHTSHELNSPGRPEQIAVSRFLTDDDAVDAHMSAMSEAVVARLDTLASGIAKLREAGHDIEAIAPAGAIYLSMRIGAHGKTTPDGKKLESSEDIRAYILSHAGVGLVPFECFGLRDGGGWFRASVGAVSREDCARVVDKLGAALAALTD